MKLNTTQPQLKILPMSDLILHEEYSPERVKKLSERIMKDSCLKNPVIVSRIKGIGKYMVLDGATRTTALKYLGFRDIFTQVVNYYDNSITLDTWHHLLPMHGGKKILQNILTEVSAFGEYATLQKAESLLRKRDIISYFLFFDNTCLMIKDERGIPTERLAVLRKLVRYYEKPGGIIRIHYSDLGESLKKNGNIYMAHIFPSYSKHELIRFAQSGLSLPAGITRHIIPGRALGFSIKTSLLKTDKISLHKKNELLQKEYETKLIENRMRFYPEGVFIFND